MKIRAIRINSDEIADFVWAGGEKDLFTVSRPAWVIRILAWNVLKDTHLGGRDLYHCHIAHVSRVARFFDSVKRHPSSIRRDRGKNSVGDLFLIRSAKIGDVNSVIAFERNLPISGKCRGRKAGQRESEENHFSHGNATVMKKVAASASTRTIKYTNPPKRNLKMLINHPWR